MNTKKILFVVRNDIDTKPGGDTIQVHYTKAELENLGFLIDYLHTMGKENRRYFSKLKSYDLVHFFNLPLAYQYYDLAEFCQANSIPTVLSSIFWDMREFEVQSRAVNSYKRILLKIASMIPSNIVKRTFEFKVKSLAYNKYYFNFLRNILTYFDLILPNSISEAKCLQETFDVKIDFEVVHNGARISSKSVEIPFSLPESFFLCVGRVEYRKNQLNLIRALKGLNIPLVLIGDINNSEKDYWLACQKEAKDSCVELIQISNQPIEILSQVYSIANLHVQPSWFETPGLSSLEAGAVGCPIVCTEVGSAKEYFFQYADYCNPNDVDSIRNAVLQAMKKPREKNQLRNFILSNYTWKIAAKETAQAYEKI